MFRVGSWLYNRNSPTSASTQSLDALSESQELENALGAATLIMNDDIDGAEERLSEGNSSFHKLGKGIVTFIRATLGLEQDIMREAAERLAEAEASAYNDQHKTHHNAHALNAYRSAVYEPGTEYLLCQSMAQLMAALVGVLNESLTESIKAFYKLRKAYIALDSIVQMEGTYSESESKQQVMLGPLSSSTVETPPRAHSSRTSSSNDNTGHSTFGHSSTPSGLERNEIGMKPTPRSDQQGKDTACLNSLPNTDIPSNSVDQFIHSGTNLCFGLLLLLISMVPPAFNKLLYIVGFKGNRSKGLRMLWQASKSHNLTGAVAALTLLAFYNGFVRCFDILPDVSPQREDDIEGYPMQRLAELLADMRARFPQSQLWVLEESRMEAAHRRLENALQLLSTPVKSPLKQVEALCVFETSLNAMYLHRYELCAESFLKCVELNSWSKAMYYYIAAASHLVLYRQNLNHSRALANQHASKAEKLFYEVPQHAGKKRFMASQLPFDTFVSRKIAKWQLRAKQWNVGFIDAIGVDPIEEMIYFWNGHNRMPVAQLEQSLKKLEWSESTDNKTWGREDTDEHAILALLRASLLRSLKRHAEAKNVLKSQILCHDKAIFKGHLKDDWTCPTAHYEMAANLWMERRLYRPCVSSVECEVAIDKERDITQDNVQEFKTPEPSTGEIQLPPKEDSGKVQECKLWLEKAAKWESFELDARIGLKIAMAEETLRKWETLYAA